MRAGTALVALARGLERELADGLQRRGVQLRARRARPPSRRSACRRRRSSARDRRPRLRAASPPGRFASTNFVTRGGVSADGAAAPLAGVCADARGATVVPLASTHQRARDQLPLSRSSLRTSRPPRGPSAKVVPARITAKPCRLPPRSVLDGRRVTTVRADTRQVSVPAAPADSSSTPSGGTGGATPAFMMNTMAMQAIERRPGERSSRLRLPADAQRALVQARPGLDAVRHQPALRGRWSPRRSGRCCRRWRAPCSRSARAAATTCRSYPLRGAACAGSVSSPIRSSTTGCARVASGCGIDVDVRAATAEALPVADHSVDAVIATLVLCSVRDPEATLREVRRVLRPGGRFVFVEHVAARARHRAPLRAARRAPDLARAVRRLPPRSRHRPR